MGLLLIRIQDRFSMPRVSYPLALVGDKNADKKPVMALITTLDYRVNTLEPHNNVSKTEKIVSRTTRFILVILDF